jgi:serine-type D-Ala-D-Ala carboxypeptidase (penicillin-binding protein 5/6)
MREIALLTLLLVPNWSIFSDFRQNIDNYLKPVATVVTQVASLERVVVPPMKKDQAEYASNAKASYSIDLATNTELLSSNADRKLQIASLTKLMTAYIVLKDSASLDETVTVPSFSLQPEDAVVGIAAGERYTRRDLLSGMLINSGSDAAQSLAILSSGSTAAFVTKMNTAASSLGLTNTHFANTVGWDDENNYSSARDIANLTRVLLGNTYFKETVSQKTKTITSTSGRDITLTNTNKLLGTGGYIGVKTGYTYGAGECLVSLESIDSNNILTVVLGAGNRFSETESTNIWTRGHFLW